MPLTSCNRKFSTTNRFCFQTSTGEEESTMSDPMFKMLEEAINMNRDTKDHMREANEAKNQARELLDKADATLAQAKALVDNGFSMDDYPKLIRALIDHLTSVEYDNQDEVDAVVNHLEGALAAIDESDLNTTAEQVQELPDDMIVKDITCEEVREYDVKIGDQVMTYRIQNPKTLHYRKGGTTHRVTGSDGVTHCIPSNTVIRWKNKPGYPEVMF